MAPVPWLPDAPLGAAVWRSLAGVTSASWAASPILSPRASGGAGAGAGVGNAAAAGHAWHVWVNVSVAAASDGASIQVMLPQSAEPGNACAWECGSFGGTFTSEWISVHAGGGHTQLRAVVPPASATKIPAAASVVGECTPVWRSGVAAKLPVAGIESVEWSAARPGHTMYPALHVAATSGDYSFLAQAC